MGLGADRGCECVGYQAHDPQGTEHPNMTLNNLVESVRFTGGIGVVGVFVPQDPGGADELAKQGQVAFDFGLLWFKGQTMGIGQCPVKKYNRAAARPDRGRQGRAVLHRLPRAAAGRRRPTPTSTSTPATTAGPRSCSSRPWPTPESRSTVPTTQRRDHGRRAERQDGWRSWPPTAWNGWSWSSPARR